MDPYKAVYYVQNLENNLTFLFNQSVLSQLAQLTNSEAMDLDKNKFSMCIKHMINTQLRGVEDSYEHDEEIVAKRKSHKSEEDLIELEKPQKNLMGKDRDWGVMITNVVITNITYPSSIINAMNDQREAEYQRKIVETNAEAAKQKVEIEAQANKQKIMLDSEARLFSLIKDAEAQAKRLEIETKMKLDTAKAEADARVMIAQGDAQAIMLRAKAEADAKIMLGEVYANHPALMQREMMGDIVLAMRDFYTSPNSKIIISDGGEKSGNNFVTQMLTMQAMFNGNNPGIGGIANPNLNAIETQQH